MEKSGCILGKPNLIEYEDRNELRHTKIKLRVRKIFVIASQRHGEIQMQTLTETFQDLVVVLYRSQHTSLSNIVWINRVVIYLLDCFYYTIRETKFLFYVPKIVNKCL